MVITKELIESFKTNKGGYTFLTISILGGLIDGTSVRKGWKINSIGKEITHEAVALIENDVQRRNERLEKREDEHQKCIKNNPKHGKKLPKKQRKKKRIKAIKVAHQRKEPKPKYAKDPNAIDFLFSYEWRTVRMIVLKRDAARCACCGASPKTGAVMNVDHIKPRRTHPHLALDPDNLQVLCNACNHGKGNWDDTDWRNKPDNVIILRKAKS